MNDAAAPLNDLGRQLALMLPVLIVAGGGLLVMLVDAFVRKLRKDNLFGLSLLLLTAAVAAQLLSPAALADGTVMRGMLTCQPLTRIFNLLFLLIGLYTVTFATSAFDRSGRYRGEFYPLLLFAVVGMMVMAAATDLLSLYLGLETMSLATYVMVAGPRGSLRHSEAGFKYLLLGGFASAFLLFGMGMLYGFAGATSYAGIQAALDGGEGGVALLAIGSGMVLVGFGFKVAMVPFHMWTPDVYDGAPAYVTGFMATGIKAAAFAALLRFVWLLAPAVADYWFPLLAVLAVLTMTAGNLIALAQNGIKRMLAYSSIAHAGYLLLGVLAVLVPAREQGAAMRTSEIVEAAGSGLVFYLVGYALMNLAAFGVVVYLSRSQDEEADLIAGYAGLSRRHPLVAASLAVAMFSLAGVPPSVGFMGKFYVFESVVRAGLVPLAVWGVINSLLSVYYYLRVVVVMYMKPAAEEGYSGQNWETAVAVAFLALLVIVFGIVPGQLYEQAALAFRLMAF